MEQSRPDRPRQHLEYPEDTMFELVARVAERYPDEPAYEFYNRKTTYAQFIRRIERAARALWAFGVRPEDAARTAYYFDLLLGDDLTGRKNHIVEDGYKYLELADIS